MPRSTLRFKPSFFAPLWAVSVMLALPVAALSFSFSFPLEATASSLLLSTLTAISGRATGAPLPFTIRLADIEGPWIRQKKW